MKKILGLLLLSISLHSCDDGDMQLKTFNFDNETVQECNSLLYIINGKEVMILDIPGSNFLQTPTEPGNPIVYTLTSSDNLIYRLYSDNVTSSTICSTIPPASPTVKEEYVANPGGQIQIITNVLTEVNSTTKSTKISYTHQIRLINCQFSNGDQTNTYTDFLFGNYISENNTMSYNFSINTDSCDSNTIYRNNSNQALILDFNTFNFPTATGTTTVTLDTDNRIISRLYTGGSLSNSSICASTLPSPLELLEEWIAEEGTAEITTALTDINGTTYFEHTITLLNCNYKKDDLSYFHDQFTFGTYLVPN